MLTRRWRTNDLGPFVARFKASGLVRESVRRGIPVTISTVYGWVAGRHTPRPEHVLMIHELSGGAVTCEQILRHRSIVTRGRG